MRKLRSIEIERLSVEEFRQAEKMPLVVVLDDVRSLYNVGSVFRTCDAFRVEAVYLCGITATPPSTEIHKTALGAEESVRWQYFKTADDAVEQLKADGYMVYAVEQAEGSIILSGEGREESGEREGYGEASSLPFREGAGVGLVLGNEVKGVHQSTIDLCDGCIEIPQWGTKHSLNVAVAAGIVVWEFAQRHLLCEK